jgi:hypothetical protein
MKFLTLKKWILFGFLTACGTKETPKRPSPVEGLASQVKATVPPAVGEELDSTRDSLGQGNSPGSAPGSAPVNAPGIGGGGALGGEQEGSASAAPRGLNAQLVSPLECIFPNSMVRCGLKEDQNWVTPLLRSLDSPGI